MKFFWIGLCLSLLTFNSFAQDSNFELSGTVTSQTGDALDGAYIKIGDQYFWTSEDGFYSAKLAEGTYQIEVSIIGFTSLDTVIQLHENRKLDFVLEQSVNGLDEVMLEGHQHKKRVSRFYMSIMSIYRSNFRVL